MSEYRKQEHLFLREKSYGCPKMPSKMALQTLEKRTMRSILGLSLCPRCHSWAVITPAEQRTQKPRSLQLSGKRQKNLTEKVTSLFLNCSIYSLRIFEVSLLKKNCYFS